MRQARRVDGVNQVELTIAAVKLLALCDKERLYEKLVRASIPHAEH